MRLGSLTAGLLITLLVVSVVFVPGAVAQSASMASTDSVAEDRIYSSSHLATDSDGTNYVGDEPLSATDSDDQLVRRFTFERKPAEPGLISAQMRFEIPDQVVELTTAIPNAGTVTATEGFEPTGDGNYTWDGDTTQPSISLSLSVNRTGEYHLRSTMNKQSSDTESGYMFVDTGDWAIASVPPASVYWSAYQNEPAVTFVTETAVSGSGVAGDRMVFLGSHTKDTRTIDGQSVTVVAPDAATLASPPADILDSFAAASPHLPSSPVSRSVVIAAPTSVDWGPYGLADRSDTWVRADQPIDEPGNVWLHEFVHLRQNFTTATDTRWIREGMPEYYGALLTLEEGRTDFGAFNDYLDRGTQSRYDDVVLSQPDTWTSLANYAKGALVFGTLDRQIRLDSEQKFAARTLFEAMNEHDQPIDEAFLESETAALASAETVANLEAYATTTETPDMWTRTEHQAAFGAEPPDITARVDTTGISGPYRNHTAEDVPILVTGEQISFQVTLTNDGEGTGTYERELTVNGTVVASASGSLDGGETTTVSLSHTFERPGSKSLEMGTTTWNITVNTPGAPVVSDVQLSDSQVAVGSQTIISATLTNTQSWPANGTVPVTIDGTLITQWSVQLIGSETVERNVSATLTEAGEHEISAGSETVTISVTDGSLTTEPLITDSQAAQTTTSPADTGATPIETPGFTIGSGLIALLWLGVWFGRKNT